MVEWIFMSIIPEEWKKAITVSLHEDKGSED